MGRLKLAADLLKEGKCKKKTPTRRGLTPEEFSHKYDISDWGPGWQKVFPPRKEKK